VGNGRGPYNGRKERRRDRALVGYAFLFFVVSGSLFFGSCVLIYLRFLLLVFLS
jgi:hypothetical protein